MLDKLVDERRSESRICERRIVVIVHLTRSEARFVVRDEGRGFNTAPRARVTLPIDFAPDKIAVRRLSTP